MAKKQPSMTAAAFDAAMEGRRFGEQQEGMEKAGRIPKALRLYLVDGVAMRDACYQAGRISPQAVYLALKKIMPQPKTRARQVTCPHCHKRFALPARRARTSA